MYFDQYLTMSHWPSSNYFTGVQASINVPSTGISGTGEKFGINTEGKLGRKGLRGHHYIKGLASIIVRGDRSSTNSLNIEPFRMIYGDPGDAEPWRY